MPDFTGCLYLTEEYHVAVLSIIKGQDLRNENVETNKLKKSLR